MTAVETFPARAAFFASARAHPTRATVLPWLPRRLAFRLLPGLFIGRTVKELDRAPQPEAEGPEPRVAGPASYRRPSTHVSIRTPRSV